LNFGNDAQFLVQERNWKYLTHAIGES
jgi:hypothetical protein